jgi:hypothetical protein
MLRIICILILLASTTMVWSGCSNGSQNPVIPSGNQAMDILPDQADSLDQQHHSIAGMWTANFNLETLDVSISPCREMSGHMNVTTLLPAPTFIVVSFDPFSGVMNVDATIRNPHNLDGYDLRLIVFTDNNGNRLMNPDAWTSLYDIAGGTQVNPFVAFAKTVTLRKFAAYSQHTERLQLYFPGGYTSVSFAIDVSYPGNCDEPYEITNFTQGILYEKSGYATKVSVNVYDWQNDTNSVQLVCPAIIGSNPIGLGKINYTTWSGTLINTLGASSGTYYGYIAATSTNSSTLTLYDSVTISVSPICRNGWAKTWGGTSYEWAYDLAIDQNQDIYVTGFFNGSADFDPGPDQVNLDSGGSYSIYLSKFDSYGNLKWAKSWNPGYLNYGMGVTTEQSGVHITGGGVSLRKYDHSGNQIRDLYWGGYGEDICYDLASDSSSNIYSVGVFEQTVDFDPGSGVDNHTSAGNKDVFISKLDSNGNYIWAKTFGGPSNVSGNSLAFESSGDFFVTGWFFGTVDFDPGSYVQQRVSTNYPIGYEDAYLSRFDSNGNLSWIQSWGGPLHVDGKDVAVNNNSGLVYVGGYFDGYANFNPSGGFTLNSNGNTDGCVSFFTTSGMFLQALQLGGTGYDYVESVAVDNSGNLYVAGRFESTVDFDPGTGTDSRTSNGQSDVYLCKFAGNTLVWTRTWGGVDYDTGWNVITDCFDNIYLAGYFIGTVDFDPGTGTDNHTANGQNDAFLIKLLPNGYWQ